MQVLKENWKRYLTSSFVTFLSVFLPILAFDLSTINLEVATLTAIGIACMRAALKAIIEIFYNYEKEQ